MYDTTPPACPQRRRGALSAWYVFANLGFYPAVYGTGDLVVSGPMFDRIVITPASAPG